MRGGLKALVIGMATALTLLLQPICAFAAPEGTHRVGTSDEFAQAIQTIENEQVTDATIELTADIALDESFDGVAGKHITVCGNRDSAYLLTWPGNTEIVKLEGAVTLENVHVSPKTFYANGHHLTLGEGFGGGEDGQKRMIVYGGSDSDLTADTHVTVLGGVYELIAGGNSAGTLTGNTNVEFGGNTRFSNASDGADPDTAYVNGTVPSAGDPKGGDRRVVEKTEHYNLFFNSITVSEFNPVMVTVYKQGHLAYGIYGGGIGGNVTGNTNITMTGGEVKSVYGGSFNDLQSLLDDSDITGKDAVATDAERDTRAVVAGNTNVVIEDTAHVPATTRPQWATTGSYDLPGSYGGSFHSSVQNTHVTVGGEALIETHIKKRR